MVNDMKRIYRLTFAAVLTMITAACTQKELTQIDNPAQNDMRLVDRTFSATLNASKATLDGLRPVWCEGDEIAVFDGTAIRKFTLSSGAGTSNACFSGQVAEDATGFQAVYPYALATGVTDTLMTVTLPAVQVIAENEVVDQRALAQVAEETDGCFGFRNICALIKFEISGSDVKSIMLRGTDAEKVTGKFTATPDADTITPNGSSVLTVEAAGEAFAEGTYYAAIVPNNFANGLKVSATTSDGTVMVRSTDNACYFGRNVCKNLGDITDGADMLPTEIFSVDDFSIFAANADMYPESATVVLGDNVDLSEASATVFPAKAFSGTFDGQNHSLFNFTVESSESAGVFYAVEGKVKNLVFGSANGTGYDGTSVIRHSGSAANDQKYNVAPIITVRGTGSLENVINYATVEIAENGIGAAYGAGIVSQMQSTAFIKDCMNYGTVSSSAPANNWIDLAGIAATCSGKGSVISGCENHGAITFSSASCAVTINMGGIIGGCTAGKYQDCRNFGKVTVEQATYTSAINLGGILGWNNAAITGISGCVNELGADVTNLASNNKEIDLAGICGKVGGANPIEDCINRATIENKGVTSSGLNLGGIVGDVVTGITAVSPILRCENAASAIVKNSAAMTAGYEQIAGIAGRSKSAVEISGNVNNGAVSNNAALVNLVIGGICGENGTTGLKKFESNSNNGTITNTGKITTRYCIGGIMGRSAIANTFKNCSNTGAVIAQGDGPAYTGGIIGCVNTGAFTADHCDNSGAVSMTGVMSNGYTGGIAGYVDVPTKIAINIRYCHNSGTVTNACTTGGNKYQYTGGIIGSIHNKTDSATVSYCVNDGEVVSRSAMTNANGLRLGGICGGSVYANKFLNCRNNGNVRNESNSTQAHVGGILGYSSGASIFTADTCSVSAVIKSNGNSTTVNIGGIIGATGANNIEIKDCCSAATIAPADGTVTNFNAHQIEGGPYTTQVLKTVSNCKVAGSVNGVSVTADNFAGYISATGTPAGCSFWSDAE